MSTPLEIVVKGNVSEANASLKSVQAELGKTALAAQKTDSSLKLAGNAGTKGFTELAGVIAKTNSPLSKMSGAIQFLSTIIPGVGIATAIGFAIGPIIEFVHGLGGASEAARKAAEENKKFVASLDDVRAKGIATGLSLQGFVNVARDQTQSLETRNEALKQANKILGDHGDKLTLVNIATQAVTDQINKFTQATIQQALATKFSDRAADLIIKQRDAFAELRKEQTKLFDLQKKPQISISATGEERLTAEGAAAEIQTKKVLDLAKAYDIVAREGLRMSAQLSAAQLSAAQLFGSLDGSKNITGIIAKIKAQIKELTDQQPSLLSEKAISENVTSIKTLQDELDRLLGKVKKDAISKETIFDVISKLNRQLGIDALDAQKKIGDINSAISHLVDKFKLTASSPLIITLQAEIQDIKLSEHFKQVFKDIHIEPIPIPFEIAKGIQDVKDRLAEAFKTDFAPPKQNEAFQFGLPTNLNESDFDNLKNIAFLKGAGVVNGFQNGIKMAVTALRGDALGKLAEKVKEELKAIGQVITDFKNSVAGSIGEALGNALAGGKDIFKSLFGNIFSELGSALQQLGKIAIGVGIGIKGIKKAFESLNPIVAIGAGIALIALGTFIKASIPKVPGFASGVTNFRGGAAIVGERGPELVTLPRGSNVIPNNKISGAGMGYGMDVFVHAEIAGDKLILVTDRARARRGRNG